MYTVKAYEPYETIEVHAKTDSVTVGLQAGACKCWAVLDESGNVATYKNPLTGEVNYSVYETRYVARKDAEFYNTRGD